MADNDSVITALVKCTHFFISQPVKMKSGNQCFSERVYVASIGDDMLFRYALLHHLGVCLAKRTDRLVLNEERIPITTSFKNNRLTVARVSVEQKVWVPPNTSMQEDH